MVTYTSSADSASTSDTSVVVAPYVRLGKIDPSLAAGLTWSASGTGTLRVMGTVMGFGSAFVGDPGALDVTGTGNLSVTVDAGGAIIGDFSITGAITRLVNAGTITGRALLWRNSTQVDTTVQNIGLMDGLSRGYLNLQFGAGTDRLENYGTMVAAAANVVQFGTMTVVNTGTMSAGQYNIYGYVVSVINSGTISLNDPNVASASIEAGTLTLSNTGTVGGVYATEAALIDNRGSIAFVRVTGFANASTITNSGRILGDVSLGGQGDLYDGADGQVLGTVRMGGGDDSAVGGVLADTIFGDAGWDVLEGGGGDDVLDGGDGNDLLDGGLGRDRMTGGYGDDTFSVDDARDQVFEASGGGTDIIITTVDFRLGDGQEIEELAADPSVGVRGLILTGNALAQGITGGDGDDTLSGGGGSGDTLVGGLGDDTYRVTVSDTRIVEGDDAGHDVVLTTVDYALADHVEDLIAATPRSTGALGLTGNALDNRIVAGAGDDVLDGAAGADRMKGGDGDDSYYVDDANDIVLDTSGFDTVHAGISYRMTKPIEALVLTGAADLDATGNALGNTITGNDGANVLSGRGGIDVLTGGAGADTFLFATAARAGSLATITDFVAGEDRIALNSAVFGRIAVGVLDPALFTEGSPTTRDQHILYDAATGLLFFDRDGVGTAHASVAFAAVQPGTVLTAADFVVI